MNFAKRSNARGEKLVLGWFAPRSCWKKMIRGKMYYFHQENTRDGYESALLDLSQLKVRLGEERPNAAIWQAQKDSFEQVQAWFDRFGATNKEKKLANQVNEYLVWIDKKMEAQELPPSIPLQEFTEGGRFDFEKEFGANILEFEIVASVDRSQIQFVNAKWQERLSRLDEVPQKHPQTIEYWLEKYLAHVATKTTNADRSNKLVRFKKFAILESHISTIDEDYVDAYFAYLNSSKSEKGKDVSKRGELSQKSKEGYFKAFRMFVDWSSQRKQCELTKPQNLHSHFKFSEPKGVQVKRLERQSQIWTPEEMKFAIENLPAPHNCYVALMSNCGFRHTDVSELQWHQLDLKNKRIIYQRHKRKDSLTAPIVSFFLWDITAKLIKENRSKDSKFVFTNSRGNQVARSIEMFWKNYRPEKLRHRTLDKIRSTAASYIAKHDKSVRSLFLGHALTELADINYSAYADGKPLAELDEAIAFWGSMLGFATPPVKKVTLTPEMVQALKKLGYSV